MSVAKILELTARSEKSFEDAIASGVAKAAKTVHGIREAWISGQKVLVDDGKVVGYQVDFKVTFVLD